MRSMHPRPDPQRRDPHPGAAYEPRPPRRRTCLNGKLVYGDGIFAPDGAFTLDCTIRDLSESGAKVTIFRRQPLPPDLYLIVVKSGIAHRARVVWLDFPARGLKFSASYQLDAALPDDLKFLRRLWIALGDRAGDNQSLG